MSLIEFVSQEKADAVKHRWLNGVLSGKQTDVQRAESCLKLLYERHKLPPPTVLWANSPFEAANSDNDLMKYVLDGDALAGSDLFLSKFKDSSRLHALDWDDFAAFDAWPWLHFRLEWLDNFILRAAADTYGIEFLAKRLSYYSHVGELALLEILSHCHPDYDYLISPLLGLFSEVEAVFFREETVVLFKKPVTVSVDERYRLHALGGEAMGYSDGFKLYVIDGVLMPEPLGSIPPSRWDIQEFHKLGNVSQRSVFIKHFGNERFWELGKNKKCVHKNRDGNELWEMPEAGRDNLLFLRVRCPSTGNFYFLRVPPHFTDASAARLWTLHCEQKEHSFIVET